jgi:O-antigen/teichoic acid export membrane protein
MTGNFTQLLQTKFAADSVINIVSVFFLGVCGLLLNFIIARKYGAPTLGIFNEVYALYIVFSQFAALGVQVSSLKHTAQHATDRAECGGLITAAFIVVSVSATLFSLILFLLRPWIAGFFHSGGVATGILWVIPGLWCFSLNKLFLNILNGFRFMKAYAVFSTIRYILMLLTLIVLIQLDVAGEKLSVIFSVSEGFLCFLLILYHRDYFSVTDVSRVGQWIKQHLSFGLRSMIGGVTADLNTRIDVIILGHFTSDRIVGIYGFASTFIEGLGQIPYILKQNMDPVLTRMVMEKRFHDVKTMVNKGRTLAFGGMFMIGIAAILIYRPAIPIMTANPDFLQSWPVFSILMAGLIIQSSYMPFSGILVQSGYPFLQTMHQLAFTATNFLLNLILVPLFGIIGSAVATASAYVLFVLYLRYFTYRALKLSI